jgi:hypothetical protein
MHGFEMDLFWSQYPSSFIAGHSAGTLFIKDACMDVAERDSKLDFCLFLILME